MRYVVDLQRAEELVGSLATAYTSRRVYGEHQRSTESLRSLRSVLAGYFHETEADQFALCMSHGSLTHEGVPVGRGSNVLQLAEQLERKHCTAVVLRAGVAVAEIAALLVWLADKNPLAPKPELENIDLACGEDTTPEEEAEESECFSSTEDAFRNSFRVYHSAAEVLEGVMDSARADGTFDLDEVRELTHWTAEEAFRLDAGLLGPIQLLRRDSYTYQHSINVFLISTTLLQPLARSPDELARFAAAALLHDIGKSRIPPRVLHKKGRFTEEEHAIMQRHTEFGAEILLGFDNVDPLAVEVAYCHHMRDRGLGYPNTTLPLRPGPITNVIQVADMFEALTADRPYKKRVSVSEAAGIIEKTPGMESKRTAVLMLLGRLTNSPPGSEVFLSSGERAIVLTVDREPERQPRVLIVTDPVGGELEVPELVDLNADGAGRRIEKVVLRPEKLDRQMLGAITGSAI